MAKKTSNQLIKITFDPKLSEATESKTVLLRTTENQVVGNSVKRVFHPLIEGLPTELTIKKGEIREVTLEQFKQLYELGLIDTPEDIEQRKKQRNQVNANVASNPKEYKMSAQLSHLYEDNFVLVE